MTEITRGIVIEERNGMFELEIDYQLTSAYSDKLVRGNIIVADANDILKNQCFRIYKVTKDIMGHFTVYAKHISFDISRDYTEGLTIENQSCEYCLNMLFRNSYFSQKFTGYSDIINAQNYSVASMNLLSAIGGTRGSILDTFGTGAEILRDNYDFYVLNKRGHDNGVTIEYSKNMTGMDYEEDDTDLITKIRAIAKYTPENEEEQIIHTYVESPNILSYETPFIGEIDFTEKFEEDEVPTVEKLQTLASRYFEDNKCDLVKFNYKIEFVPLSKCAGYEDIEDKISLCDTVTIIDYRYGLNTKAKVIRTEYNILKNRFESMELGEPRTTLGDVVSTGSAKGEKGDKGDKGDKGEDGTVGDFPNSLPSTPVLSAELYGFASIELNWTYENKVYYNYELYGSKTKDFTPNTFDLIHSGQTSSYLFQAKPGETWYFRVCAVNTHGNRTAFSSQIVVTTTKVDDLSNYFTEAAIGQAVIGSLTADYMSAGIIKGNWIDAKNLSVTDGNGKRTLDIDSFGNVNLDVASLKISSSSVATESYASNQANTSLSNAKTYADNVSNTAQTNAINAAKDYTNTKITDVKAEIKLTTDSITQRVSSTESTLITTTNKIDNLQIGGRNVVLNSGFKGAVRNEKTIPKWSFWGEARVWHYNQIETYNRPNSVYIQNKSATSGGIYQSISSTQIPPSTEVTFSGYLDRENNVKSMNFAIEYYDSSGNIITSVSLGSGRVTKTFTTHSTYSNLRIVAVHGGSFSTEGGFLITVGEIKLELGNKASAWTPALEDTDDKIDNLSLQAGGRNLLVIATKSKDRYLDYSTGATITSGLGHSTSEYTPCVPNEKYTLSYDYDTTTSGDYRICFYDSSKAFITGIMGNYTGKFNRTVTSPNNAAYVRVSAPNYDKTKLEIGNKATAWTLAPEDIGSSIATVDSKVETTNSRVAEIITNLDGITQRVSSTESTLTTTTNKIDNLQVGSTNLLIGSSDVSKFTDYWVNNSCSMLDSYYKGSRIYKASQAWVDYGFKLSSLSSELSTGKKYTFSVYVKSSSSSYLPDIFVYGGGWNARLGTATTSWQRFTIKGTFSDLASELRVEPATTSSDSASQYLMVAAMQLEEGEVLTDYSPAPEDVANKLDNLQIGGRNLYIIKNESKGYLQYDNTPALAPPQSGVNEVTSDYIPVSPNEEYCFQIWVTAPNSSAYLWAAYRLFDVNKQPLDSRVVATDSVLLADGRSYRLMNISVSNSNARYLRVSGRHYNDAKFKVEKGNLPTDWTPAPEDVQGQIDSVESKVETTNSRVASIETTLDGITQRVSSTESTLITTTNKIDNLKVGGTNLLPNTKTFKDWRLQHGHLLSDTYLGFKVFNYDYKTDSGINTTDLYLNNSLEIEPNTQYTLSFYVKGTGKFFSYVHPNAMIRAENCKGSTWGSANPGDGGITNEITNRDTWERFWLTWTSGANVSGSKSVIVARQYAGLGNSSLYICGVKLEKGNKPTDWTPAPEDVTNKIDTLKIGTRNYILNSGLTKDSSGFTLKSGVSRDTNKKTPNGNNSFYINVSGLTADSWRAAYQARTGIIEVGKTYTISANVFVPSNHGIDRGASLELICWVSDNVRTGTFDVPIDTSVVDKWQSLSRTFTVPANTTFFTMQTYVVRNGKLYVGDYSLVEGDKGIWAPAPEDVQGQIDSANSTISSLTTRVSAAEQKITSNAIVSTVTSSTSWSTQTNNITAAQNKANSASTAASNAQSTANTANSTANANKTNISNLSTRVSTAESSITQLSNSITSKVSENDVKSIIKQSPNEIQVGFNDINDYITINPSTGITVNHTDGSYSRMSQSGFQRFINGSGHTYHSLHASGEFQLSGYANETHTVTLPSAFDDVYWGDIFYMSWVHETHSGNSSTYYVLTDIQSTEGTVYWSGSHWCFDITSHVEMVRSTNPDGTRTYSNGYVYWIAMA